MYTTTSLNALLMFKARQLIILIYLFQMSSKSYMLSCEKIETIEKESISDLKQKTELKIVKYKCVVYNK